MKYVKSKSTIFFKFTSGISESGGEGSKQSTKYLIRRCLRHSSNVIIFVMLSIKNSASFFSVPVYPAFENIIVKALHH